MAREIRRTDSQGLIVGVLSELALEIIDDEIKLSNGKTKKCKRIVAKDKKLIVQLVLKQQMALLNFLHRVFVQVLHERAKKVSLLSLGKQ